MKDGHLSIKFSIIQEATMKMLQQHFTSLGLLVLLLMSGMSGWAQLGKLHGTVKEGKEGVPMATVKLYQGKLFTKGTLTDANGKYEFAMLEPGEYAVHVVTSTDTLIQSVSVSPGESQPFDLTVVANAVMDTIVIGGERLVFDVDRNVETIDRREIREMAITRDINSIAATAPGFVQKDAGDPLYFKGARDNANATYVDGLKIRGSDQMPLGAINQISIMTGGVPAEYGDVLGAVIVVSTYNPSMAMGHFGKPLTKAERKARRLEKKNGNSESCLDCNLEMACR
jgi:hypothetical protein